MPDFFTAEEAFKVGEDSIFRAAIGVELGPCDSESMVYVESEKEQWRVYSRVPIARYRMIA